MEMMKRDIIKKVVTAGLILGCFCVCSYFETTYSREAEIIKIEAEEICQAEDATGNVWEFYATNLRVGDKVRLIMDDRHTINNIFDDVVKDVKMIETDK